MTRLLCDLCWVDLKAALDAKDRAAGGPTAPPDGLYLMRVGYPPADGG